MPVCKDQCRGGGATVDLLMAAVAGLHGWQIEGGGPDQTGSVRPAWFNHLPISRAMYLHTKTQYRGVWSSLIDSWVWAFY